MNTRLPLRSGSAVAGLVGAAACTRSAQAQKSGPLTLVVQFDLATGVAVASDGRRFVNFPRWTDDAPVSVAEAPPDGGLRFISRKGSSMTHPRHPPPAAQGMARRGAASIEETPA